MIASSKIYPEKRKGIEKNVPLQLHIFFDKKRVSVFNTGYRCDIDIIKDKDGNDIMRQWDAEKQLMKKGTVNKAGQTASYVNTYLNAIRGTVDTWAAKNPNGTISKLLSELRKVAGKKEKAKPIKVLDIYAHFDRFLSERKVGGNRYRHYLVLKRFLQRYEAKSGQPLSFDIDLYSFEKFLQNEPTRTEKKRGLNTIIGMLTHLAAFNYSKVKLQLKI